MNRQLYISKSFSEVILLLRSLSPLSLCSFLLSLLLYVDLFHFKKMQQASMPSCFFLRALFVLFSRCTTPARPFSQRKPKNRCFFLCAWSSFSQYSFSAAFGIRDRAQVMQIADFFSVVKCFFEVPTYESIVICFSYFIVSEWHSSHQALSHSWMLTYVKSRSLLDDSMGDRSFIAVAQFDRLIKDW